MHGQMIKKSQHYIVHCAVSMKMSKATPRKVIGNSDGKPKELNISKLSLPRSLASSTRMISFSNCGGVLLITLCTVLNRVDQASL